MHDPCRPSTFFFSPYEQIMSSLVFVVAPASAARQRDFTTTGCCTPVVMILQAPMTATRPSPLGEALARMLLGRAPLHNQGEEGVRQGGTPKPLDFTASNSSSIPKVLHNNSSLPYFRVGSTITWTVEQQQRTSDFLPGNGTLGFKGQ